MPPLLPSKPTRDVTKISAAWITQLLVCLDYAMTHPAADGSTLKNNGGSLSVVRPYHNTGASGSGTTEYNGYFKVIQSGENLVKVVNGANEPAAICGSFTAGSSNISCTATELTTSGAGVVHLRIYYDSGYHYEFGFASTLPSVLQEIYIALASISADGIPAQVWTDGAINLNGQYVT